MRSNKATVPPSEGKHKELGGGGCAGGHSQKEKVTLFGVTVSSDKVMYNLSLRVLFREKKDKETIIFYCYTMGMRHCDFRGLLLNRVDNKK